MRTITDIYAEYKIPKNLQLHQLRVAAVAKIMCDNLTVSVDTENVVCAALLHDMGNIIKFDLGVFPESLEPEGREYWEGVKKEYIETYGTNEHEASIHIIREITGSERLAYLAECVDLGHVDERMDTDDFGVKIVSYVDNRMGLTGVVSVNERRADNARRYPEFETWREAFYDSILVVEKQIQDVCTLDLQTVTNEMLAPIVEELRSFEI